MDCVEVCPVDCFYEGENMLVINPVECIDCGVCQPECPADAIQAEDEPGAEQWIEFNQKWSDIWPNITQMRPEDVPEDAEAWQDVEGKMEYFSEAPGRGD